MSVDPTYMHNATSPPANQPALRVWLVEDDASIRWVLERALRASGIEISTELQAILQGESDRIAGLGQGTEAQVRHGISVAFRGVFSMITLYSAIGCALAWTLPRRTL